MISIFNNLLDMTCFDSSHLPLQQQVHWTRASPTQERTANGSGQHNVGEHAPHSPKRGEKLREMVVPICRKAVLEIRVGHCPPKF